MQLAVVFASKPSGENRPKRGLDWPVYKNGTTQKEHISPLRILSLSAFTYHRAAIPNFFYDGSVSTMGLYVLRLEASLLKVSFHSIDQQEAALPSDLLVAVDVAESCSQFF